MNAHLLLDIVSMQLENERIECQLARQNLKEVEKKFVIAKEDLEDSTKKFIEIKQQLFLKKQKQTANTLVDASKWQNVERCDDTEKDKQTHNIDDADTTGEKTEDNGKEEDEDHITSPPVHQESLAPLSTEDDDDIIFIEQVRQNMERCSCLRQWLQVFIWVGSAFVVSCFYGNFIFK